MPEVPTQTTQTSQTLVEAWELKKILKVASIADADVTIMPLGEKYSTSLVRFEVLSPDHSTLVAVDTVGLFNRLNYSIMIDSEGVKKLLKVIPWSRMLVRVVFDGASLSVHSMDGDARINTTIVEKPESIMSGLIEHLNEWHPKVIMRNVDASTLLSWFKPFSMTRLSEARFKLLYNGFMITTNNENALLMLDTKLVPGEYEADGIFEVGYNLKYVTEFLEEVKRGRVNVVLGYDKPMIVEAELESKASVETIARIVQAPMVE
jgi:hypothetical protein